MNNLEHFSTKFQRTRRNAMKIGAVSAFAILAKLAKPTPAAAAIGPGTGECFLKGTTIRTADGGRNVESLAIGDLLPTVFGGMRPIQWIGCYRYKRGDPSRPWVKDVLPVR